MKKTSVLQKPKGCVVTTPKRGSRSNPQRSLEISFLNEKDFGFAKTERISCNNSPTQDHASNPARKFTLKFFFK